MGDSVIVEKWGEERKESKREAVIRETLGIVQAGVIGPRHITPLACSKRQSTDKVKYTKQVHSQGHARSHTHLEDLVHRWR